MGIIYDKSRSDDFKPFFEQQSTFQKGKNIYNLSSGEINISHDTHVIVEGNCGGVPLTANDDRNKVYVDQTDTHTLIVGPTGSKKTRLIAMPSVVILGNVGESMVISDPKAEIYRKTAGLLQAKGYDVIAINLRNPSFSRRWNPLKIPYHFYQTNDLDRACEFANDIAQNMIPINSRDSFWENSAASLLFGLILLLFKICRESDYSEQYVTFSNVLELRNEMFRGDDKHIRNSWLWNYAKEDDIIVPSLIGTVETAKETRGGILSTFDQNMRNIAIQPGILELLGRDEIDFDGFRDKKMAVYLIVPDEKTNYHKLISLFIKQSYEYFIYLAQKNLDKNGMETGFLPIRINYILDEFSSLPTVKDFPAMITAARSRNIRFYLFIQSKHQLVQRYQEETETILANCTNWIFLTTRELGLLKDISELCGTKKQIPILSVALLQRLSKEEGEILILSGRKKPFITFLPDIQYYNTNRECMYLEKGLQMRKMEGNIDLLADYIKYTDAADDNTLDKAQIYYEKLCRISRKRWNWRAYEFSIDYLLFSLDIDSEKRENDADIYKKIIKHANDYRKHFEEHPKRDRAYYTLANVYSSRNEHKKMLNLLTKALQNGRKMPLCAMKLAEYYFKIGNYIKTREYIELCKVMEIDMDQDMKFGYPYLISALCMMVDVYMELGTWKHRSDQEKRDIISLITENYDAAIIAFGDKDPHIKEVKKQLDVLRTSLGIQNQIYLEE